MSSSDGLPYSTIILSISLAAFVFETYVSARQLPHLTCKDVPKTLKPYLAELSKASEAEKDKASQLDKDKDESVTPIHAFWKSQAYSLDKLQFGILTDLFGQLETICLLTGFLQFFFDIGKHEPNNWTGLKGLWNLAGQLGGSYAQGEIGRSLVFAGLLTLISTITSAPFSLIRTFVIEERHSFNKTDLRTWTTDLVKSLVLTAAIGGPLLAGVLAIIRWAGKTFVLYLLVFVAVLQILVIPAYIYVLAPLFNTFTPLSAFTDKPDYVNVGQRLIKLANSIRFPLGKVMVVDGSKRSAHSNAYFIGIPFFPKRVVIFDTLLDQNKPEEVEAVLAHELGHWKLNHTLRMMGSAQVILLVNLSLISLVLFSPSLYAAFGFRPEMTLAQKYLSLSADPSEHLPIIVGLMLSQFLLGPLDTLLQFANNWQSRVMEYEADAFAKNLGYAQQLKVGLIRLMSKNSAVLTYDALYSAFHHSHPTLIERLAALEQIDKKSQ
ncbi:uncharacterized protein L969DRAFT_45748 [Mixia osmundae IAM 14324]|uniref:CAAX prenyl protease n=1 Tax=Mixia osmundae (strain CBS 9802 / IAM 14324 / JCM 22182 / KY 12970) TaxID=764103 RepID=G7DXG2_MIXOS|nr:uncharacterized protein L969DRAFT_45748 [Mixia osmundae IAM 14324]KEI41234.1 hypothetical protein L969DRAFT_45748 [Mixia osmundae IAM 14324]GAA95272.1 hypothetical protein E5Q_01928 [Mixia osmundae IAM 14324]